MSKDILITTVLACLYLGGAVGIGWHLARTVRRRQKPKAPIAASLPPPEGMRRPAEFGPLLRPQAEIEAMRAAIIADQLALRQESPKQRRQRLAHQDGTERERVLHWLWHWEDYGRGVRRSRYPGWVAA